MSGSKVTSSSELPGSLLYEHINHSFAVRPVISLKASTVVNSGSGATYYMID